MDICDLLLKYITILCICLFACTYSRQTPSRYNVPYAGRSAKEFEEVQNTVRELELTMLKKRMSETEAEAVIQDEHSEAYKDIRSGKIGDILLTLEDAKMWLDAAKGTKRKKRKIENFRNYPSKKWDMPIKYRIDTSSIRNATEQAIIEKALKGWEKETCVRFEKTSHFYSRDQYLYFTQIESEGCNSYIGKAGYEDMAYDYDYILDNKKQPVHLAKDCFDAAGTVMHEIGHALGLYHEAQRMDRDDHVIILKGNVIFDDLSNFLKPDDPSEVETKGIPYDIGSLMHYSALDFSTDEENFKFTILPYNLDKLFVLGQRVEIGFYDAKIINLAYCPVSKHLECSNGGYTDPNNESQCKCPAGWQGTLCTEVQEGAPGCSPLSRLADHTEEDYGKTFSLYSPNYRDPVSWKYELGDECFWVIQVPTSYQIAWWIGRDSDNSGTGYYFGLPIERTGCQFWLEVKIPGEIRGIRICGLMNDTTVTNMTKPHLSYSHKLLISFRTFSDFYLPMDDVFVRGFQLQYELRHYSPPPRTTLLPEFQSYKDGFKTTTRDYNSWTFPGYVYPTINIPNDFEEPSYNGFNYGDSTSEDEGHLSAGAIVGIVIGGIVAILLKAWCITVRVRTVRQRTVVRHRILVEERSGPRVATNSRPNLPRQVNTVTGPVPSPTQDAPPSYESAVRPSVPSVANNLAPQTTSTGTSINSRPRPSVTLPSGVTLREGDLIVVRTLERPRAPNRGRTANAVPNHSSGSPVLMNPNLLRDC